MATRKDEFEQQEIIRVFREAGEFLGRMMVEHLGNQKAVDAGPLLMNQREASQHLGVGRTTLSRLRERRKIKVVMIHSRPMYRREDLDKYASSLKPR